MPLAEFFLTMKKEEQAKNKIKYEQLVEKIKREEEEWNSFTDEQKNERRLKNAQATNERKARDEEERKERSNKEIELARKVKELQSQDANEKRKTIMESSVEHNKKARIERSMIHSKRLCRWQFELYSIQKNKKKFEKRLRDIKQLDPDFIFRPEFCEEYIEYK